MGLDVYTGNLGSGKSLDATLVIKGSIEQGKRVIANYKVNENEIHEQEKIYLKEIFFPRKYPPQERKKESKYHYVETKDLNVRYLINHVKKYHTMRKESQTLLVIDEASFIFNSRKWNDDDRFDWIRFFKLSRKLGFDVILITQDINDIDKQLRKLFDFNVIHRKLTSYKIFKPLSYLGINFFVRVYMYMAINKKDRAEMFIYKKAYSKLYDTYDTFEDIEELFDFD